MPSSVEAVAGDLSSSAGLSNAGFAGEYPTFCWPDGSAAVAAVDNVERTRAANVRVGKNLVSMDITSLLFDMEMIYGFQ